ncbi:hypothetical protein Sango_2884300 [Sesamum angolense]|uniref:Uncharacterized protein n=1 Tax=Sesamum angolense TaxID=2727404 RepID=A0AAE1T6D4_9LAMI|nr:hypothetical protein Sango_2884300 [Sesamum angolense]
MDWAQRMVFYAAGLSYFAYSHESVPDDGMRSCPVDVSTSSYVYGGGGLYDYDELGLADRFSNIVHARDQPLWDGSNQSQLGVIAKLVDIKADGHIYECIYDRISQWADRISPSDHTLPGDYYSTKKFVKDLDLPVEKIHACKNSCMLYWKEMSIWSTANIVGVRLYSSRATVEHMMWHAIHQPEDGLTCHPPHAEAWKHFDQMYSDFAEEPRNVRLGLYTDGFAPHSRKVCYFACHKQFLPALHSYRRNKKAFMKNCVENKVARPKLTGDQILDRVANISTAVEMPLLLPDGYSTITSG